MKINELNTITDDVDEPPAPLWLSASDTANRTCEKPPNEVNSHM
ncbi:hypothetical protein [Enteractinococcus helveticum]|nr:hypothetical protein [Enteractinococcus helveticum]